jgi:hypothetical protein
MPNSSSPLRWWSGAPQGAGQTGIPIEQPLRLQLGAPVAPGWSAGGTGTCQWQLRNLNCRLYEVLPGGGLRDVRINVSSRGDSVVIRPERQLSSTSYAITTLMPNTRYRLIISGDWWAQCPGGSAFLSNKGARHARIHNRSAFGMAILGRPSARRALPRYGDVLYPARHSAVGLRR